MASSFEKSVKGGTKVKLAAPKSKYVEHILVATNTGEAGVAEIFRTLQHRLRDSTWTIVFKGLIIAHLMIREGEQDVTLRYIAANPRKMAISNFSGVQLQGRNIRNYAQYLLERARAFRDTKVDYVRSGEGRLKKLTVDKGLLRETEAVQHQIGALVKCDLFSDEAENEITLTAFRLLVTDLLALFYVMNEGVINILEHFFEMSRYDAERALTIYKTFSKQTNQVVEYLVMARQYEHSTRVEVPKLKHAPTSLTSALEEYTQDPDFEINRRQYLAQQEAKKGGGKGGKLSVTDKAKAAQARHGGKDASSSVKAGSASAPPVPEKPAAKGPDPDLIDFFESIEQNQQPMAQSMPPPPQQFGQQQQPYPIQMQISQPDQQQAFGSQTNPFGMPSINMPQQQNNNSPFAQPSSPFPTSQTVLPNMSGATYGGFASQPQPAMTTGSSSLPSVPQNNTLSYQNTGFGQQQSGVLQAPLQPQSTNPFRQSMMATGSSGPVFGGGNSIVTSPSIRHTSNPFSKPPSNQPFDMTTNNYHNNTSAELDASSPFQLTPSQSFSPITASPAGTVSRSTNPFAQGASSPSTQQQAQTPFTPLVPQPTGSTNPFRQSMLPTSPTGQPWTQGQGTIGGLEQLPTVPVFPRPGEQRQQ